MNHALMKERVFALYDGELADDARWEVEIHIEGCSECRAMIEHWRATAQIFFKQPKPLASDFFVHRVMERIKIESRPRSAIWRKVYVSWLIPALGLAAVLVFVALPKRQPVSVETLLFGETQESSSLDEMLGFAMEEQS